MKQNLLVTVLILLLISLMTVDVNGQSKNDTQEWIRSTLLSIGFDYASNEDITFENGAITFDHLDEGNDLRYIYTVKIEDIVSVNFRLDEYDLRMTLGMNSENTWHETIYREDGSLYHSKDKTNALVVIFNSTSEVNITERLENAFNHLVELYGGQIISNTF